MTDTSEGTLDNSIPADAQFSLTLGRAAGIVGAVGGQERLAGRMSIMSWEIERYGVVQMPDRGGFMRTRLTGMAGMFLVPHVRHHQQLTRRRRSQHTMDDVDILSLLSLPFLSYLSSPSPSHQIYQDTRALLLSRAKSHWSMAAIVRILTSNDTAEINEFLKMLVASTDALGLIQETISAFAQLHRMRQWFAWANGLFGQVIVESCGRRREALGTGFE